MKLKLKILFLGFVLPMLVHAQKGVYESCHMATPPVIDGNLDDWQTDWALDPKGHFIYNICNDDNNLYIRLKVSDNVTQQKIGMFGLTVLLNPKGKKIGKVGLTYPVAKDPSELKKDRPTGPVSAAQLIDIKKGWVKDAEVLELVGLAKEKIVSSRLGLMNGIECFITADASGDYLYEAKIPFKAYHIDKSTVKVLGVAFETGKVIIPKGNNTATPPPSGFQNRGYGRGGYGGGYGGAYGGYGGGYGGAGMQQGTPYHYSEMAVSTYLAVGVKLQ
jgi:hypothetical protein